MVRYPYEYIGMSVCRVLVVDIHKEEEDRCCCDRCLEVKLHPAGRPVQGRKWSIPLDAG